jgi:hypothetical protein
MNVNEEGILYKDDTTKKRTIDKEYNDNRVNKQESQNNLVLLLRGLDTTHRAPLIRSFAVSVFYRVDERSMLIGLAFYGAAVFFRAGAGLVIPLSSTSPRPL